MPRKPGEKYMLEEKIKANKLYNQSRPARHDFYSSTAWRKLRDYKRRLNPLCEECLRNGILTQGELVDHIIPIEEGGAMLDLANLQTLCKACHNKKHSKIQARGD